MKKIFFLFLIFIPMVTSAQSDNFLGGHITFSRDPGANDYKIYLTLYTDCTKDPVSPVQRVYVSSFNCFSDSINMQLIQTIDITPYLPNMNSPCDTGSNPVPAGALQSIYEGIWIPDTSCTDYLVAWLGCCRSTSITTAPYNPDIIIGTTINDLSIYNNSPIFLNSIVEPYRCKDQMKLPNFYNGIFDVDGDSLAFELEYCIDNTLSPIFYNTPYSPQSPVSTDSNGVLDMVQQSIQCIQIKEYRDGKLISSIFAERLINVTECDFDPTGVDQEKEENEVKIYPNPFTSEISISNLGNQSIEVKIYDLAGKLHIFNKFAGAESIIIEAAHLTAGIYFAEIVTGDQRKTVKLIKTK